MIAVLLCAGYATRLYPLTRDFPKPLLPVAGKPVIDYLVDQVESLDGIETLHVVTNARFYPQFSEWAASRKIAPASPLKIVVHDDGTTANTQRLGAVGDLDFVLRRTDTPGPMLVAAGDNIFRFPIAAAWERFLSGNRHLVLALRQEDRQQLQKTGVLVLDDQNRVLSLHEKPQDPPSHWSCPPLYFLQPSARRHLQDLMAEGQHPDAPGHFIGYLCRREPVEAFKIDGGRLDIGDLRSYHDADRRLQSEPLFIG